MMHLPQTAPLPLAFQAHLDALAFLDGWEERYGYIIDLGKAHEGLPEVERTPERLVQGCISQVWLILKEQEDGTLHMAADSDALIVRGLLALLTSAFHGQPKAEINPKAVMQALEGVGLLQNLSLNRRHGLASVLAAVEKAINLG